MAQTIKRTSGVRYPHCRDCQTEVASRHQWMTQPCPATDGTRAHHPQPAHLMFSWVDFRELEDLSEMLPTNNPRTHFGILSAEILAPHDILPLIKDMSFDEQIIVVGKLRSLEMILAQHLMHNDPWHPRHEILRTGHAILETVREPLNDELLDAKEAAHRLGYSVRWLYKNADSLPFTIREKTGRLHFSKLGLDEYLRNQRKPA
jgi:hypothetical protein